MKELTEVGLLIKSIEMEYYNGKQLGETSDTYELIGYSFNIGQFEKAQELVEDGELEKSQAMGLFKNYEQEGYENDLYIGSRYAPYFKEALTGIHMSNDKRGETRQMVVQFDKLHCFQYIQFLVRGDSLYVLCSMRSCNFKKNLKEDVLLTAILAENVKSVLENQLDISLKDIIIRFNIGSLHIFKKDVE